VQRIYPNISVLLPLFSSFSLTLLISSFPQDAREGVNLVNEADLLSEFQRARDAGEMDDAEFRRVRDLLISGRSNKEGERRDTGPDSGLEDRRPANPPPEHPTLTDPE